MSVQTTTRHWKEIARFKDVSAEEWNDYHWQLANRLTTIADFEQVLNLTAEQRADLEACMGKFRVSVTPYYASLMDPDDPHCPVRMQAVPTPAELVVRPEDLKDAVSEDFDSPTPRITHRYPDRVLFVVTEMCSMYCRHCTRRRLVGGTEDIVGQERDRQRHQVHRALARGPRRADQRRRPAGPLRRQARGDPRPRARHRPRRDHPHRLAHAGRLPAAHHARALRDAQEVPPALLQHALQPPQGVHRRESVRACAMLADAGIPLGNQTVLMRGINDCANVMKSLCHKLVQYRVKPYYFYQCDLAEGTAHFRTSVAKGIEIAESLRGHTTGFAVPTYIIDAIGGGGKTPVMPQYMISQAPGQGHPAQLRGRDQQVHRARRLRRARVPLPRLRGRTASGSAWPACSTTTAPRSARSGTRACRRSPTARRACRTRRAT